MDLADGSTVTIQVRNPIWHRRTAYAKSMHLPEVETYTGVVVRKHKAVKEGQIGLTTNDPRFTLRVIDINRIVGM